MKKIIILGAGSVGSSVAAKLVSEDNEITVIDQNEEKLKDLRRFANRSGPPFCLDAGWD
jgi:Trk K+ transport system NAD-binding subunit